MDLEQQILSAGSGFSFVLAEALTEPSAVEPDAGVYFNYNLDTQSTYYSVSILSRCAAKHHSEHRIFLLIFFKDFGLISWFGFVW
jgi:hypothetical protein